MEKINYITIQVGNICNFDCKYCFYDKTKINNLILFNRYDELKKLLETIPLDDNVVINLSGGEPTLYKENIYKIYKVINKLNRNLYSEFKFEMYSNGTNLYLMNELLKNDIISPNLCNISWDGINYNNIRLNKTNIDVTEKLKKFKNTNINNALIRTAITNESVDYLLDSVKFLIDNNYKRWEYYLLVDYPDYYSDIFINKFKNQLEKLINYVININSFNFYNISDFIYLSKNKDKITRIFCKKIGSPLYISAEGIVSPCGLCSNDCIYFNKDNNNFSADISDIDKIYSQYNKYIDAFKNINYEKCINCKNVQCTECKFTVQFRNSNNKELQQCKLRDAEYEVFKKYI